ncbi:malonyl-ACP O-methyltransferase BioC [Thiohalobacter sp. IOR34]|uniref:malonyl-ACP O-methyltransferase BioC n=1 Tax=Thiohalobacter sp. IOR34 TaxID=3057176 RepID=UPI0025B0CEB2|nr:malonyl-ACP O-methyltransferase BioC [Thiohalobacter sp. IOR34]WJW75727.1 malonyl-ACP O-methyltransferase BioC [Thiohalobacter sp. IOR34]
MNEGQRIDKRQMRRAFAAAAADYDAGAVLQREIGERLLERLALLRLRPATLLDLGSGTGQIAEGLLRRYRGARVVALDIAEPMLARARRRGGWRRRPLPVCGDAECLPLADASIDMILSNLCLQWVDDLDAAFAEFRRVLRPGGALLFTSFGPDTLCELREAWAAVDAIPHVNRFPDMHEVGDALLRAGLAGPVMDRELLTLTYADLRSLLADIRDIGAHNVIQGRPRGLTGKARWQAFAANYEARRREGRLPASYEVVYGHAWAPEDSRLRAEDGSVCIPVEGLRRR